MVKALRQGGLEMGAVTVEVEAEIGVAVGIGAETASRFESGLVR
jgi:hypothetical protein